MNNRHIKNALKDALTNMIKYQLAYKIIQETVEAIKKMTKAVCELDANLTEFNKVVENRSKIQKSVTYVK